MRSALRPTRTADAVARVTVQGLSTLLACVLVPLQAQAQERDAEARDGAWTVKVQAPDGRVRTASVAIDGYDGTWQEAAPKGRASASACKGRKVPVTVQSSTRTLLLFTVWGETVGPACPTLTVTLRPLTPTVLEGPVDLGSHAAETPEVHASHSPAAAGAAPSAPGAAGAPGKTPMGTAGLVRMTRR